MIAGLMKCYNISWGEVLNMSYANVCLMGAATPTFDSDKNKDDTRPADGKENEWRIKEFQRMYLNKE